MNENEAYCFEGTKLIDKKYEHEFELVENIPRDHVIWYVPMPKGYLALAKCIDRCHVDTTDLKYIKCDQYEEIRKGCMYVSAGLNVIQTIKHLNGYYKKNSYSKNSYTRKKAEYVKKALDCLMPYIEEV